MSHHRSLRTRWIIWSIGYFPDAKTAPTRLPPLVPEMALIGIPAWSRTSRTPRWAMARTAPPLKASPIVGFLEGIVSSPKRNPCYSASKASERGRPACRTGRLHPAIEKGTKLSRTQLIKVCGEQALMEGETRAPTTVRYGLRTTKNFRPCRLIKSRIF